MTIEQALEDVENNVMYAAVFQPRDRNDFDRGNARLIIRKINTRGGPQLAMHELDAFGRTTSGVYGADMIRTIFAKTEARWANARFGAIDPTTFAWRSFNEIELPNNLWTRIVL